MPIHNTAQYLRASIDSILSQSFKDFELLIIDDASTDNSGEIVKNYQDPRIKYVQNYDNLGVARTLNRGLDMVTGDYIARFDGDDISAPKRLERQFSYMEKNHDIGVVSSWYDMIGRYKGVTVRQPCGASCVRASLMLQNPVCHSASMIRRRVLFDNGLKYDNTFNYSEDYDLWSRISEHAGLDNIPEILLKVRIHNESVSRISSDKMSAQRNSLLKRELNKIGVEPTNEELIFHANIGWGGRLYSRDSVNKAERWFCHLFLKNEEHQHHEVEGMKSALSLAWYRLCSNSGNLGFWIWRRWMTSSLGRYYRPSFEEKIKFFASIVYNAYIKRATVGNA